MSFIHHDPADLLAMSRAARSIANYRAKHRDWCVPLHEARADGSLLRFAEAAIVLASEFADKHHAQRAQVELDRMALNASFYEQNGGQSADDDE
jgi:hypothetical protein